MAKTFSASGTISPSVEVIVNDLTFQQPQASTHRAGIVGFASKGPVNTATLIRSHRGYKTTFGNPHPEDGDPYMAYAADLYLMFSNELYVVRVADTSETSAEKAETASVDIPAAGQVAEITSDIPGPYSFSKTSYFRWRLNGVLSPKTLVVLADADHPLTAVQSTGYSADQLAEDLNAYLDPLVDGVEFFVTTGDEIGVRSTFSYGPNASLEIVSVKDSIAGGATTVSGGSNVNENVTGLGQGMTVAQYTGGLDRYPNDGYQVAGDWNFTGLTGLNLRVVVDGTDSQSIDNVVQVIDLSAFDGDASVTTAQIVTAINDQIADGDIPGGFEAVSVGDNLSLRTLHAGRDAKLLVKADSSTFEIFGFDTPHVDPTDDTSDTTVHATAVGTTPAGVSGATNIQELGLVTGAAASAGVISITVEADSPGIEGNSTSVRVVNNPKQGNFTIEVINKGNQVENWGPLTKNDQSSYYAPTYLESNSSYVRVVDVTTVAAPPKDGLYPLTGGSDGIPADPDAQDAMLIGNEESFTGIYALSDPEQWEIDLLAIPGHSSTSVVAAMISLCENRGDTLAIVDPPFGFTVNEIVAWQNGVHPDNATRFDSSHAALFWPWLQMTDTYNRIPVWVPPSGGVLAAFARSDSLNRPWFAVAGTTRGLVPGVTAVFTRPSKEERDEMYGNRNCVNPIIERPGRDGLYIWGNKTMRRAISALDRINIQRLVFVLAREVRRIGNGLIFDPNDETFRSRFEEEANAYLRRVQAERGIYDFRLVADETVNTADVIDRNEFRAMLGVQPTRAVEFMFVEIGLHPTGSFAENLDR